MGGVKTGRVKGAQCEMGGPANGNGGPAQGLAWLPSCSGSVVAVTVAAAGVPHHRTPRQVGYSWGGGHLGASKSWGKTTVASNVGIHTAKGREGRGRTGSTRNKGRITDPRGKRGGQQRFEKHAKARQVHPRWSASDMAEGLSATSPRASTPSPPGVLAAA